MLKEETLIKIATLIKVPAEKLKAAITGDKEADVEIPEDLIVFTKDEIETRDTNQKNEGIKAGKEIGIKEVRKAAGLDENASKDPAKVAQAIIDKATADAKVKPDEKVTQLQEQVNLLQKSLGEKDNEINTHKQTAASVSLDRKIFAAFPKERSETLTDDEYITLIKSSHNIKEVDGKLVIEKDGQILRDGKTQNPLPLNDAIGGIFKERKGWLTESGAGAGGRGGGDKNPPVGAFSKKSEVIADYERQGKNINGAAGQEIVAKLAELKKANPSFDMEN